MSGETVSSNGIHVAGSFQGWNASGTTMTDAGNGIYEVHACVDANTLVEYKFLNDNDWGGVESVPAISQKGHTNNGETNDNRWFWSGAGDDTLMLPAFVFGGSAPSGKYAVRLAVDLKSEDAVSADGVHVAGSIQKAAGFPEWNPSATQMANLYAKNKIHEVILCVADGDYEYKFVNGNAWGKDESVPSSCATNNNRGVSVSAADVEAKLVCFGSCDACPGAPLTKFKATFQIDMKKECNFEKVDIAGGKINGWAGGDFLTDDDMDGVYTITVELDSGVEIAHKVRKIDADGNISWEGGADRKYFVHNDTTFAVRCFGLDEPCSGSVIAPADITFKVDMSDEIPEDTIYVMGSFTSPAWQSGAIQMTPNVDNPDIYEVTVEKVCNEYFEYKFVNEPYDPGMDGETFPDTTDRACVKDNGVGGFNRHYTRTSDEATELFYVYNSCTMGSSMATKNIAKDVRISPNPASGVFYVTLKDAKVVSIDVMSLDGRIVRHTEANDSHVKVNVNGLNGVYLVNIQDQFGRSTVQKIVIQ
ncbi:MAG: T9SS type A sorting domain-containing protein, partial [Bacteroidia bacterium]